LLTGPICNSVLRTSGSARRLERLARTNLFVVAEAEGFRLHAALRDALRAQLERDEPGRVRVLAERAADWSARHGDREGAVAYAWGAERHDRFAELVEHSASDLYSPGRLPLLERWRARADEPLLARYPALAVWAAIAHLQQGRADDALRLVE